MPLCGSMRAMQLVSQMLAQISPLMASSSLRLPTGLPWSVTCPAAPLQSCIRPVTGPALPTAETITNVIMSSKHCVHHIVVLEDIPHWILTGRVGK